MERKRTAMMLTAFLVLTSAAGPLATHHTTASGTIVLASTTKAFISSAARALMSASAKTAFVSASAVML